MRRKFYYCFHDFIYLDCFVYSGNLLAGVEYLPELFDWQANVVWWFWYQLYCALSFSGAVSCCLVICLSFCFSVLYYVSLCWATDNKLESWMVFFWRLLFLLCLQLFFLLIFMVSYCNWMCRASEFSREYDGACLQMRMSYSPAAHLFLFLVQWTDCNLAGALGLLRILIYKVRSKVFWLLDVHIELRNLVGVTTDKFSSCCRYMWMGQLQCLPMKEKQALRNSMVICVFFLND